MSKKILLIFLLLTCIGPIWLIANGKIDFDLDWRNAERLSAHLAPEPKFTPEAVIQVYEARAFNWRGIFAVHTWIAVKPQNALQYTVYQVIGWRLLTGKGNSAVVAMIDIPDRAWFGQEPKVIYDLRGPMAQKLIPQIAQAAINYPYPKYYDAWPGPNSNTFIAYIARQVPEMKLILPSNALGKDYLPSSAYFARTPSNTGYQFSINGLFGVMLAKSEGVEINLLGLVYGINPLTGTIKLPGIGDLQLKKLYK